MVDIIACCMICFSAIQAGKQFTFGAVEPDILLMSGALLKTKLLWHRCPIEYVVLWILSFVIF
jgi:hypothetical protein